MGVTLEGFAAKTSKEKVLDAFNQVIKKNHPNAKIEERQIIVFEDLVCRKPDDVTIDIYEDEYGVIVTASHKFRFNFMHQGLSEFFPFNRFDINETSMLFQFDRCRNGRTLERIVISDSSQRRISYPFEDPNQKFHVGQNEDIYFDSLPRFIKELYNNDFHSIALEKNAVRYNLSDFDIEEYYFV